MQNGPIVNRFAGTAFVFFLLGGLLLYAVVQVQAWLGHFTPRRHLAAETVTMYWLFVVASWLPVLTVAYLYPHVA